MGQIGIWQLVILTIIVGVPLVCFQRILPRAGMSPWLSLVSIIPLGTFVLLVVLAFARWASQEPERVFD